jgi:hypothetical protein
MASSNKKVTIDVAIQTQEEKLDKLDKELEDIKKKTTELSNKKLQLKVEADTTKLKDVDAQIKKVEGELKQLKGKADVDDSKVKDLQGKLQSLQNQKINIQTDIDKSKLQIDRQNIEMQVEVEKSQLEKAKAEADSMDGDTIEMSLQLAYQNFAQGIATCKQGVSELYDNIKQVEQAGMQSEQNLAFLSMNLGLAEGKKQLQEINSIVASMPGDDSTLRSILSTAQATGAALSSEDMRNGAAAMADYLAGAAANGKMMAEAENDLKDYLLNGNTACLERDSIYKSQIDKLKEGKTVQERINLLNEAAAATGYKGLSQQDTLINKQAEWEGMIYNSQDALSQLWMGAEKGAMDYILKLNEASNGLVGMGIVAGQMVLGPMTEIMTGLGQIGVGFKTLKDAADFTGITTKLSGLKTALINVGSAAKTAAVDFATTLKGALVSVGQAMKTAALAAVDLGKKVLMAGYNALKAAAMWLYEKAQVAASALAKAAAAIPTYALAIAEWFLASPILIVVVAIVALIAVLWYLYNTNDSVRASIDGFIDSLRGLWDWIVSFPSGIDLINQALTWLGEQFSNVGTTLTDIWTNVVNAFQTYGPLIAEALFVMATGGIGAIVLLIMNMNGMPTQIGAVLQNVLSRVASFVGSLVSQFASGASNAVNNFLSRIRQMPAAFAAELNKMIQQAIDFANRLPQIIGDAARRALANWFGITGEGSPGYIYYAFEEELEAMEDISKENKVPVNIGRTASDMLAEWGNPHLGVKLGNSASNQNTSGTVNGNGAGGNVNYTFNLYGDIDNEDRMQKFIDAVVRELQWNNETAGRNIDTL